MVCWVRGNRIPWCLWVCVVVYWLRGRRGRDWAKEATWAGLGEGGDVAETGRGRRRGSPMRIYEFQSKGTLSARLTTQSNRNRGSIFKITPISVLHPNNLEGTCLGLLFRVRGGRRRGWARGEIEGVLLPLRGTRSVTRSEQTLACFSGAWHQRLWPFGCRQCCVWPEMSGWEGWREGGEGGKGGGARGRERERGEGRDGGGGDDVSEGE